MAYEVHSNDKCALFSSERDAINALWLLAGYHDIKLPEQIRKPVFLIQDKARNSIVLISNVRDRSDNNILVAIRLNEKRKEIQVNEVKSVYGKTSLKEYLHNHMELQQLNVIDKKKAEILSRVLGLQLPTTLITSSHKQNISLKKSNVNTILA